MMLRWRRRVASAPARQVGRRGGHFAHRGDAVGHEERQRPGVRRAAGSVVEKVDVHVHQTRHQKPPGAVHLLGARWHRHGAGRADSGDASGRDQHGARTDHPAPGDVHNRDILDGHGAPLRACAGRTARRRGQRQSRRQRKRDQASRAQLQMVPKNRNHRQCPESPRKSRTCIRGRGGRSRQQACSATFPRCRFVPCGAAAAAAASAIIFHPDAGGAELCRAPDGGSNKNAVDR